MSTSTNRVFVTLAAVAVALVGLLPAAHLHTGGDRTLVHRHVIRDAETPHAGGAIGHDAGHDHTDARLLSNSYDIGKQPGGLGRPVEPPRFVAPPVRATASAIADKTLLPARDPPFRFVSSPAPPALV